MGNHQCSGYQGSTSHRLGKLTKLCALYPFTFTCIDNLLFINPKLDCVDFRVAYCGAICTTSQCSRMSRIALKTG